MSISILSTKLHIPKNSNATIIRSQLFDRLNEAKQNKLLLISAPAGFGKTTLVSEWVSTAGYRVGWVSLDTIDSEPIRFWTYFISALQTAIPDIGKDLLNVLQLPQSPPIDSLLVSLLNELDTLSEDCILVLDDYHLVENHTIDNHLAIFLRHLPSKIHIIITTREDPQLPLASLRARQQMTEIRVNDLRFTLSETTDLLNHAMGLNLSGDDISTLNKRTEGWITGLQLAALALKQTKPNDSSNFVQQFSGSHRFILNYLIEEILQRQPNHIRHFLIQTSILERMSGSLCDAVVEGTSLSGQDTLEYLERTNLLIVPLDDQHQWYRYHHLFKDVLQAQLTKEDPERLPILHLRACDWYEQRGFRSDAIHHAIASRNFQYAADLIEQEWLATNRTQFQNTTWVGWVQALPDDVIQTRIILTLGLAWNLLFSGKLEKAAIRLKDADRLLELTTNVDNDSENSSNDINLSNYVDYSIQALLAIGQAFHAQAIEDSFRTIKYAHQALINLPEEDDYIIGLASSMLGLAYWGKGDLNAASKYMSDTVFHLRMTNHYLFSISGSYALAEIKIAQGRLFDAINIYQEALQFASTLGKPVLPGTADLHLGLSKLYREQGKVDAARQHLRSCEDLGEKAALPEWPYDLYLTQAQLKVDHGDLDGALEYLEEAEKLYHRTPVPDVRPIAALKAQIWLRQGRLSDVLYWLRSQNMSLEEGVNTSGIEYLQEFEHMIMARTLIIQYETDQSEQMIRKSVEILTHLLGIAEAGGRDGSVIKILVLQALAYKVQHNIVRGLILLERALRLAKPEAYVRVFVDEGLLMAELLLEAINQDIMPVYSSQLLAAFDKETLQNLEQTGLFPESVTLPQNSSFEPLSEREIEVLSLIAAGMKNQDIADELFISINTVRYHTKNLYGKLSVNKRTQAVARAQELNLI